MFFFYKGTWRSGALQRSALGHQPIRSHHLGLRPALPEHLLCSRQCPHTQWALRSDPVPLVPKEKPVWGVGSRVGGCPAAGSAGPGHAGHRGAHNKPAATGTPLRAAQSWVPGGAPGRMSGLFLSGPFVTLCMFPNSALGQKATAGAEMTVSLNGPPADPSGARAAGSCPAGRHLPSLLVKPRACLEPAISLTETSA